MKKKNKLENRIEVLEKKLAELELQLQERPTVVNNNYYQNENKPNTFDH
ncbi:hypothetical protein [Clostridium sp. BNL1100]|nr:hypothetical protein [Clostridium sp. BNL1100]AEY65387.1 hypothetical protein Clo1100_1135 [Clostridium sp. BNL1100]